MEHVGVPKVGSHHAIAVVAGHFQDHMGLCVVYEEEDPGRRQVHVALHDGVGCAQSHQEQMPVQELCLQSCRLTWVQAVHAG